jgi:hypothetical protein
MSLRFGGERLFKVNFGGIATKGLAVGDPARGHPMRVAGGSEMLNRWLNVPVAELQAWIEQEGGSFEWLEEE